ncbi:MAG: hypothetical protein IJH78_04345 [Clostridia bacterium]|nr:hypothetical protein [Clostridia bacterium]
MADAMTKLTRDRFIPFLNAGTEAQPAWKRVDYSTIFSLDPKPQTRELDYICFENTVTEVSGYRPELAQEIALYEGNPLYDFLFELFFRLPVGSDAQRPALICFGGSGRRCWYCPACTVTLGELDTVEGRIRFTMSLGGDIVRGTYAIVDGAPVFTPEAP